MTHSQPLSNDLPNRHLYQGKELQNDFGLGVYDFHWRTYDPAAVVTWQQDPHAENYYEWSPYSWVGGNPISNIDPDGRDWYRDEDGNEILIAGTSGQIDGYEWVRADESAYLLDEVTVSAAAQRGDKVMKHRDGVSQLGGLNDIFGKRQWVGVGDQGLGIYNVDYQGRLEGLTPVAGNAPDVGLGKIKTAAKLLPQITKSSVDDFLKAGQKLDRNGLTKAGRALQKHGDRAGSAFPRAIGNAATKNAQGQQVLESILTSPGRVIRNNRFGGNDIIDAASGRGARFDSNGNMMGFLEP